jgi:hypothetical protein
MATSYEEVYDVFLSQLDDVEILYPFSTETEEEYQIRLNTILLQYLNRAINKFTNPVTSLDRDDTTLTFNNTLRKLEIEIIGMSMLKEYYRKKLNFLAQLKNSFSDKDWKSHDNSSQMNQYRQMINELETDINKLKVRNTFTDEKGGFYWTDMTVDTSGIATSGQLPEISS